MKKVDVMNIIGRTKDDDKRIKKATNVGKKIYMDEFGRIYNEEWTYIADGISVADGQGIGSEHYAYYEKMSVRQRRKASISIKA